MTCLCLGPGLPSCPAGGAAAGLWARDDRLGTGPVAPLPAIAGNAPRDSVDNWRRRNKGGRGTCGSGFESVPARRRHLVFDRDRCTTALRQSLFVAPDETQELFSGSEQSPSQLAQTSRIRLEGLGRAGNKDVFPIRISARRAARPDDRGLRPCQTRPRSAIPGRAWPGGEKQARRRTPPIQAPRAG